MKKRISYTRHILLILASIFSLLPTCILFFNAFKDKSEMIKNPLGIPTKWTLQNFIDAWTQGNYSVSYLNTIIISGSSIILVCLLCSLAAYGLIIMGLQKSRSAILLQGYLFLSMSLPVNFIPIFFMAVKTGLINTYIGVIIPYVGGGFALYVLMLRAFMLGIPKTLFEAATLDGCGHMRIYFHVVLPLIKPALIVVAIFTALNTWNEFFLANALLQEEGMRTVSVQYLAFAGKFTSNWVLMSASGVLTIIPMLILFIIMTRRFINGLQEGGVKF